jgi:hypothetical protein
MGGNGRVPEGGGKQPAARGDAHDGPAQYLGVGCVTLFAGLAGGGMIAVLIAKIVGVATRCPSDPETGAPCDWFTYAVYGALIGAIVVPTVSIWFLRRSRKRARNSERG